MRRKKNKTERKLQIVRLFMYTLVSFVLFQYIGIFALAEIKGIYVTSENRLNAFSPKAYVNVELVENDTTNHKYLLDKDGYAFYKDGDDKKHKSVYVNNPGTNKKDVVVRAQIVANICNKSGITIGQTQAFQVIGEHLAGYETTTNNGEEVKTQIIEADMWYHPDVTVETDEDDTTIKKGTYTHKKTTNDDADNYFYYTSVLEKGTTTANLFDQVRLTEIADIPDGGYVEFHVIIDTVEVDDDYTTSDEKYYDKVKAAWGSTAVTTVNGLINTANNTTNNAN